MMKSVLLVDDDVKLCHMLREYLARRGISLSFEHDGHLGLEYVRSHAHEHDLMLLDVMLPDIDGFEVLQRLRHFSNIAVLLLSARGEASDRIHGLQLGADDYLPKPFDPEELIARIEAILRRGLRQESRFANGGEKSDLAVGILSLDLRTRVARYGRIPLDLTDIEFALMQQFVQHPGVVLTREELVASVLQQPFHPLNRNLDMHVCRLRKKLETSTPLVDSIRTIRSVGYLFSNREAGS
jgi:DNA-binding response OmpR family regulator